MEAILSSETSGTTQRTTRRHIPEDDDTLHNHRCENLKSYTCSVLCLKRLNDISCDILLGNLPGTYEFEQLNNYDLIWFESSDELIYISNSFNLYLIR
jgi:hypothetical protein